MTKVFVILSRDRHPEAEGIEESDRQSGCAWELKAEDLLTRQNVDAERDQEYEQEGDASQDQHENAEDQQ